MRRWFGGGDPRLWGAVAGLSLVVTALLGVLAARGSWYAADLDFLIEGTRGFGAGQLLKPVNDHVAPGLRLSYALFASVAPTSYGFTVVVRALLWFAACLLMAGLLHRLFARPSVTLAGTAFYALAPVSMPSFMSLSSAVNNLPAHVLGLTFVHCTLDWFERRSRAALLAGALALLGSLMFWEKSLVIVPTAFAVTRLARHTGGPARRRSALPWLLSICTPLAVFAVVYLSHADRTRRSTTWPPASVMGTLLRDSVTVVVDPMTLGGPWNWFPSTPPYYGLADPPAAVRILGLFCIGLLFALALVRRRLLWLWGAVGVYVIATVAALSIGRAATFGGLVTRQYHYWSDLAIPVTLIVAGSLDAVMSVRPRGLRMVLVVTSTVWLAGAVVSMTGFAQLWGKNASGTYLHVLQEELRRTPDVNLWDTSPPADVMPYLSGNRQISGLARLMAANPSFQSSSSVPYVVDDHGHIRQADFQTWGSAEVPNGCQVVLRGIDSVTLPLRSPVPEGDWFVRVAYLANPSAGIAASLNSGPRNVPLAGERVWPAGLANAYLRATSRAGGDSVTLRSNDPRTNLCIGNVEVGVPRVAP
jgi:hypothetical protein